MFKKLFFLILTIPVLYSTQAQAQTCEQIGVVGEHTKWAGDVNLDRNPENPDMWSGIVTLVDLVTDDMDSADSVAWKFRENGTWDRNWGTDSTGNAVFNSSTNFNVPAGTYLITFNCSTLEVTVTPTCGSIGVIGEFTKWAGDSLLTRDKEDINFFYGVVNLVDLVTDDMDSPDSVAWKFRADGSWDNNWGTDSTGNAVFNSSTNFNVPVGTYFITFNCSTLAVTITPTCGQIGVIGEHTEWAGDVNLTRSKEDPNQFSGVVTLDDKTTDDSGPQDSVEFKFRADGAWDNNWGVDSSGNGEFNGSTNFHVPLGTYLITFNCSTLAVTITPTCGDVYMIGEGVSWANDVPFKRDADNPDLWTLTYSFSANFDADGDGKIATKFRVNKNWDVNWGGTDFPSGTAVFNSGDNLPVTPGTYDITFNCSTLEFSFVENTDVCGQIGIIGDFNGFGSNLDDPTDLFPTDVMMQRDHEYPSNFTLNYNFTSGTGLLFRQDGDQAFVNVWGGTAFPKGTGVQDAALFIPVSGGKYDITFNCKSGDYSFTRLGNSVIAPKVFAMNVDGQLNEKDWNLNQNISGAFEGDGGTDPIVATFGAVYTDNALYVGINVSDSTVVSSGDTSLNDAVEIFVDGNKNGGSYDSSDVHMIVDASGTITVLQGPEGFAPQASFVEVTGGYNVEVEIAWADLGVTPEMGGQIGFDIIIDDTDDANAGPASRAVWNGGSGNAAGTSAFGDLLFGALSCGDLSMYSETIGDVAIRPFTEPATSYTAVYEFEAADNVIFRKDNQDVVTWGGANGVATIGGDAIAVDAGRYRVTFGCLDGTYTFTEEAADATVAYAQFTEDSVSIDGNLSEFQLTYGLDVGVVDGTGPLNNDVQWGALWDGNYLYLGFQVEDAVVQGTSTFNPWEQDAIEIYIDGNHDADDKYDKGFDNQIVLSRRLIEEGQVIWTKSEGDGGTDVSAEEHEAIFLETENGYNVEFKLKWSTMQFAAAKNRTIGFSVGLNDSDVNTTNRDYQAVWAGTNSNWNSTTALGDLQLAGGSLTKIQEILFNHSVQVLPNPTHGQLKIVVTDDVFKGRSTVFVHNSTGQVMMVQSKEFFGANSSANIDISRLPAGVYYINIIGDGAQAVKKVVKK